VRFELGERRRIDRDELACNASVAVFVERFLEYSAIPQKLEGKPVAVAMTALTEIPQFCSLKFPTLGRSAA